MRKYLIVVIAAFAAIAFAAVSIAAPADTATLDMKLTPKNAGTKAKPKSSTLDLNVVNGNTKRTMASLDVFVPKTVKLSLAGLPSCSRDDIATLACPKSKELGKGTADALLGVNGPAPTPLHFKVTAFKTKSEQGKDMLGFFIDDGGTLKFLTETKISKASGKFGQKLHIDVPLAAQRVGTGTWNGLVGLHTTLKKKVGKKYLIASVGCKNKKNPFKVSLHFVNNTVSPAGTITQTDTTKCSK